MTLRGWGSTWAAASTVTGGEVRCGWLLQAQGWRILRALGPDERPAGPVQGGRDAGRSGAADGRDLGICRCGISDVHSDRFDGALL